MDFDEILKDVGEFGRYQKLFIAFVILPACIPGGFHGFSQIFTVATPKTYSCRIPQTEYLNLTSEERDLIIPWETDEDGHRRSHCQMYDFDYSVFVTGSRNFTQLLKSPTIPCKYGWEYDRSTYYSTIVTEWDLVCQHNFLPTLSLEIHTIGTLIGSLFFGYLADRVGRKSAFYIAVIMQLSTGLLTAASPGFATFCVLRFLNGCTIVPSWILPLIMGLELTGPSTRASVGVMMSTFYTFGVIGLAGMAYFVRNWVHLQLAVSLPFVFILSYWWVLPESPRWLISQGRFPEMLTIVKRIVKVNRPPLPDNYFIILQRKFRRTASNAAAIAPRKYYLLDLFRTPNLRLKTCLIVFNSFANYAVYNGLNFFGVYLGEEDHLNFLLCALVELPSYLILFFTLDRFGRRLILMSSMVIGGTFCIAAALVPETQTLAVILLFLLSKFCITCSFFVTDLVASELFPTVVRGAGASLTQTVSAVGLCFSPLIAHFAQHYLFIPLIVFGALAIVGGGLGFLLPETANHTLPETLEEGEEFGRNMTWAERLAFLPRRRVNAEKVKTGPETVDLLHGIHPI